MSVTDPAHAQALDDADPLAAFRQCFEFADPHLIYLDGNSLGRVPRAVRRALEDTADAWGGSLVTGWHEWIELPRRAGDRIAAVIGARAGDVLACDSVTVNLFKLAHAALDLAPSGAVVTDAGNFPTDRYVLDGVAAQRGRELRLIECDELNGPAPDDIAAACAGGDVALVVLSHVAYRSGALADLAAIQAAARSGGARVIWDLSHSAGAVPVELAAAGAELAVGCTYKYLCAGPGAPGFLYVRGDLQELLRSPIQGWFGQRDQFSMERPYEPARGIERFLAGTPPILQLAAVEAGAELIAEAGSAAIAQKGAALTELIVELHDAWLADLGFELGTPRDPAARGAHVALRHPDAWRICRALIELAGVIPDFRGPDAIRLGVPALYTSYREVHEAMARLRDLVASGQHLKVDAAARRVT